MVAVGECLGGREHAGHDVAPFAGPCRANIAGPGMGPAMHRLILCRFSSRGASAR